MTALTCAAARRRLHAFHDRELPVSDQIAVSAHLDWCGDCAAALTDLQLVRAALRAASAARGALSRDDAAGFAAAVVNRLTAEHDASLFARLQVMFEDMHLVYAAVGAAAAAVVCVIIMLGMMRFATNERPDSLAAMVDLLATPGSNANSVAIDAASHARWAVRFQVANETAMEEAVFSLASIVTRDGRIATPRRAHGRGRSHRSNEAKLIEALLDTVSRATFEPAQVEGMPAATNVVWLLAHTTVRANKSPTFGLPVLPAAKKHVAVLTFAPPPLARV